MGYLQVEAMLGRLTMPWTVHVEHIGGATPRKVSGGALRLLGSCPAPHRRTLCGQRPLFPSRAEAGTGRGTCSGACVRAHFSSGVRPLPAGARSVFEGRAGERKGSEHGPPLLRHCADHPSRLERKGRGGPPAPRLISPSPSYPALGPNPRSCFASVRSAGYGRAGRRSINAQQWLIVVRRGRALAQRPSPVLSAVPRSSPGSPLPSAHQPLTSLNSVGPMSCDSPGSPVSPVSDRTTDSGEKKKKRDVVPIG